MSGADDLFKGFERAYLEEIEKLGGGRCLWPEPYTELTYEKLLSFVHNCIFTREDISGEPTPLPRKDYIDWYVYYWLLTKQTGQPLIVEKSRRLIISWLTRALELYCAGLKSGSALIADQVFARSQDHVWRTWYIYDQLRRNFPEWKLGDPFTYGPIMDDRLDSLILPNGSRIGSINQDPKSFRGRGITEAVLEEGSAYDQLANVWSEVRKITMGVPGKTRGHTVIIANASANPDWLELKTTEKMAA